MDNINIKRFISQVKQAKQSGSQEFRIPIKQAEELVIELSLLMVDKLNEYKSVIDELKNIDTSSSSVVNMDGGSF